MGQVRHLVNRFDLLRSLRQRGIGVAVAAHTLARQLGLLPKVLHHLPRAEGMHLAFIPINADRVARHFRLPKRVRNHGHAGGHRRDLAHAWHIAGVRIVEALHLCAKDRSAGNDRDKHPWIFYVDPKNGFAIYLFRSVEPLYRCANQLERLRVFQSDLRGWRHLGRVFGELSET